MTMTRHRQKRKKVRLMDAGPYTYQVGRAEYQRYLEWEKQKEMGLLDLAAADRREVVDQVTRQVMAQVTDEVAALVKRAADEVVARSVDWAVGLASTQVPQVLLGRANDYNKRTGQNE